MKEHNAVKRRNAKLDQLRARHDEAAADKETRAASGTGDLSHEIAVAAYYIAERRGFAPGCELDDWLAAEAERGDAP